MSTSYTTASVGLRKSLLETSVAFVFLTAVTGLLYPALTTGIAQTMMRDQASGSLVFHDGRVVGSSLIGQDWTKTPFFQTRPSAVAYDGASSGASNLGPTNPKLINDVQSRVKAWQTLRGDTTPVPGDLVTTSGPALTRTSAARPLSIRCPLWRGGRDSPKPPLTHLLRSMTNPGFSDDTTTSMFLTSTSAYNPSCARPLNLSSMHSDEDRRPDRQPSQGRTTTHQGRLKLFLGAAPGVGKTYAMLTEAHEKRREGLDVLIGWVDTHGRRDTERF